MEIADLKKDEIIEEWFLTLSPKQNTMNQYLQGMKNFTDYVGKTPGELLREAEDEIKAGKLMRERRIKKYLIGFRKHLNDYGYAPITVKGMMTGVKSFYTLFDIELPKLPRVDKKARPLEKHNKIPTKEDIREVLKIADPMERALILTGVSGGLASNEISNLRVGEFKNGYDPETGITTLPLRREKTQVDFITFLSPEASRAVIEYLEYRGRKAKNNETRRLNQLEKQRVTGDDGYLFVQRHVSSTYLKKRDENIRKLASTSIMKIYEGLSERALKNTPSGDWNLIRSHNMRKYFNSVMLNSGADSFFVEYCMGHTLDDTRAAYFRASPDKLREIYEKYVPYLTIQKEQDVSESPEFQKLKVENEVLARETAKATVERSELQELRKEMQELKEVNSSRDKLMKAIDLIMKDDEIRARLEKIS